MNRLFRLFWLLLRSRWASRCPPLGPCRTRLRVWPNDLDVFLHVNNGVYLTLCDLARVDLMLRSGSIGVVSGRRRVFLVAAETIQLYRPLRLLQPFSIATRVVGWDEKGFFVEHRFCAARAAARSSKAEARQGEETVAHALVEGRVFDQERGPIPPADVLTRLDVPIEPPPLPAWVERWRDDQRALREATRGPQKHKANVQRPTA